jgi:hypothetical protein
MGHQVVMLKDELLVGVSLLHLVHQFREVVIVSLVRLSTCRYKLNLFTAIAADAHGASQVLPQILLVPLGNYNSKGIGLTLTLEPFFEYA